MWPLPDPPPILRDHTESLLVVMTHRTSSVLEDAFFTMQLHLSIAQSAVWLSSLVRHPDLQAQVNVEGLSGLAVMLQPCTLLSVDGTCSC